MYLLVNLLPSLSVYSLPLCHFLCLQFDDPSDVLFANLALRGVDRCGDVKFDSAPELLLGDLP
jgi:hypothetical protein